MIYLFLFIFLVYTALIVMLRVRLHCWYEADLVSELIIKNNQM